MLIYTISPTGTRQVFQASEGADILRYAIDMSPARAPYSDQWVGTGEGQPVPAEVTIAVDTINVPHCTAAVVDAFSSAVRVGVMHPNGDSLIERRVLALTRASISEAGVQWGRVRISLLVDTLGVRATPLTDHSYDALVDNGGDFLYVIEEV